jgi:hypothetical protein
MESGLGGGAREKEGGHALLQIPELVTPLRGDSERIFEESDDDQETTDSWEMRPERLGINFDVILDLRSIVAELFDGIFWVCGPVARRGT